MQVSAVSHASPMLAVARTSGVATPVTAQQALDAATDAYRDALNRRIRDGG